MIRRLRTFILITGTTLSVLIAVAFVVSRWWVCMLQLGPVAVYVMAGGLHHPDSWANLRTEIGGPGAGPGELRAPISIQVDRR